MRRILLSGLSAFDSMHRGSKLSAYFHCYATKLSRTRILCRRGRPAPSQT